jgi:hypothetical protein
VIDETYRLALSESSKLKLRAVSARAEGGEDCAFQAAVLFHAAARAERRALSLLEAPAPDTRLRSAIEQCGCLIDGLDPAAAIEAWGDVLEASEHVPARVASALRGRIDPGFDAFVKQYGDAMSAVPDLTVLLGGVRGLSPAARAKVRRALTRVLAVFPGDAAGWATLSALDAAAGDFEPAWLSIGRARELHPESGWFWAMAVLLAPDALPETRAGDYLDAAYSAIQRGQAPPEVCLSFAVTSLRSAQAQRKRRDHVDRALNALAAGEARPPATPEHARYFRALRRIAGELRGNRTPGVEALYKAGLGGLAARATRDGERDPIAILAREVGAMGGRVHRAA